MALSNFTFSSSIKDIQNRIIASSIKQTSNMELLRSEEAIRDIIKSYTERFKSAEGMLTDASKYVAKSKTIINVDEFNKLFESLYIDLSALYNDIALIDEILQLNLARNKNYFLIMKKRVRELWQRLRLTRLNVFDLNPADESFYESFYSNVNIENSSNLVIDKKLGFVYLEPNYFKVHNKSFEIKNISSTVYPVENEDAGVLITTNVLNTLSGNYTDGPRDMLENGLWKEEVLCSEIPDMIVNIGSQSNPIRRTYKGVVAIVDIEYTYPVELNRLDLDVFGDKAIDVDAVLYKENSNSEWKFVREAISDDQSTWTPYSDISYTAIKGRGFDIISFINTEPVKAKHLRIVFNQQNFSLISTSDTASLSLDKQIEKDLSERRYELLKFNANLEKELTTPVNEENKSIYSKIMNAIESTRNIEDILQKISDVLVPPVNLSTLDFSKTAKFELGAWSIEPKYEEYTPAQGYFKTKPFRISDRHLVGASIVTKQSVPGETTCNWYVNIGTKDIPIVEGDNFWRKEPINFIDVRKYSVFSSWPGAFCLLDLPVDPLSAPYIGIYENGEYNEQVSNKIVFLNSRLLYFPLLRNPTMKNFVIRYQVAQFNCCNLYVLQPRPGYESDFDMTLGICSSRRDVLESLTRLVKYIIDDSTMVPINEVYTITNALSTIEEAKLWFGEIFSNCIFIDSLISSKITPIIDTVFQGITLINTTKTSTTQEDIAAYLRGDMSAGLQILSNNPNVVPLSTLRNI